LYFFCILFFYSMYRIIGGSFEASIIHMAEMIFLTYVMGYLQVFLLSNFDEGEQLKGKEILYIILCSTIYIGVSVLCGWFNRGVIVSVCFGLYMMIAYIGVLLIYKLKRNIDAKLLNEDLKAFQERGSKYEKCN
ncbi:DUF3021 family protein, partial [Anaerosporobacter sp.]